MSFGYFRQKNAFLDLYMRLFGYPYLQRAIEGEHLFRWLSMRAGDKVLDAGAGIGLNSIEAARRGASVTAVDFFPDAVVEIRANAKSAGLSEKIEVAQDDLTSLSFPAGLFDKIICHSTLEHIPQDRKALRELHRVLKPGGLLYLNVPPDTAPMPGMGLTLTALKALSFLPAVKKIVREYLLDLSSRENFEKSYRKFVWVAYHEYNDEGFSAELEKMGFRVLKYEHLEKAPAMLACSVADFLKKVCVPLFYACYPFLLLPCKLDVLFKKDKGSALSFLLQKV